MLARKHIKENEIILEEKPLVSCQFSWNKEYKYLCCDYCMLPLESAEQNVQRLSFNQPIVLPYLYEADTLFNEIQHKITHCPECNVKYCSSECLHEAKKYHSFLCKEDQPGGKFFNINEMWKKIHYPPETSTIMLIVRIFAILKSKSVPNLAERLSEFSNRAINEDLNLLHKMLGETFSEQTADLLNEFHNIFGDDDTDLGRFLTRDGFLSLLAIIGTNSQGIGTSSFANWVKNVSEIEMSDEKRQEVDDLIDSIYSIFNDTVGDFLNNEGSGLYTLQSKFNHSCLPNAEIKFPFNNHTLHVVALRDINDGEEICISYLDECQIEMSRHSRQKYLQENYLFLCECVKCLQQIDDPDRTSDEMDTDDDD
jgi:SET and MYND domain-containing protein 5